jgi:eukaryotic-like serine/threonine-protein kinase
MAPERSHLSVSVTVAAADTDLGSEASRAFFQERFRTLAGWLFILPLAFFVIIFLAQLVLGPGGGPAPPFGWPEIFHLAVSLECGALWLITRSRPLSLVWLRRLDWSGLLVLTTCLALNAAAFAETPTAFLDPAHALSVGLLGWTNTLVFRSIILPSRPGRTAALGLMSAVPMAAAILYVLFASSVTISLHRAMLVAVADLTWCALGIVIATIASHIIFGLRKDVALARQVGQYTLDEKIGEGGMGVVYRARHALLRRPTAIKLLQPGRAGLANLRRFEREVQQTARLSHPNTVAIYDYGRTPDGVFYYAMELLDGVTLDELVKSGGPLPPARVIHVLRQACGALAEAHGLGLVHRDIKPANILLTERAGELDVVKVVDFGLVRHIDAGGAEVTATAANVLTGTPLYMAPEAIRSEDAVDGRSDLYALGAVGYFLLTGLPVFEAQTLVEVCAHHLHTAPVPPSQRTRARIPADLEGLILRCLAKSPDERPATARALRDALERCADAGGWSAEEAARWWGVWRARPRPARALSPDRTTGPLHETIAIDLHGRLGVG